MKTIEDAIDEVKTDIERTLENTHAAPMRKLQRLVALEHDKGRLEDLKDNLDKVLEDLCTSS